MGTTNHSTTRPPTGDPTPPPILRHTRRVSLELSNQCNYARLHPKCPAHDADRPQILPAAVVYDVLGTLARHRFDEGRYLAFHLYNEPLLDPRLFTFIEYTRARCPAAGIIIWSNGWYLHGPLLLEMVEAGATHVMLSAYSDAEEARFLEVGDWLGRRLPEVAPPLPVYYAVRRQHDLDERMEMPELARSDRYAPCHQPLSDLTIRANGDLGLCCYDWALQETFGNLKDEAFEPCLAAAFAHMEELQAELAAGERRLPVCRACLFPRRPTEDRVAYTWPAGTLLYAPARRERPSRSAERAGGLAEDAASEAAGYWAGRSGLRYYGLVRQFLDELSPGRLLIDVGSGDTPVATYGAFERRLAIDMRHVPDHPLIEGHLADWLHFPLPEPASVVTCLQVLEHLPDRQLRPFASKLLASAQTVIVSVPYRWRRGQDTEHRQDPIDEVRLRAIMGREPLESVIVTERPNRVSHRRLIAIYRGDASGATGSPPAAEA